MLFFHKCKLDQLFLSKGTTDTDIGEVKSITDNLNIELGQAGGSDENASAAVAGGAIKRFSAELLRPDQKKLVFPTGFFRTRKIRGSSETNPDNVLSSTYTVRRHNPDTSQTAQSVSTGAVQFTVASNESFASISNLQNFILIASSAGTGTLATANVGAVVPLTASLT